MVTVIVSCAAASAAIGIFSTASALRQPRTTAAGHAGPLHDYSGLLMLVIGTALARVLFGTGRMWSALVMPALASRCR